MSISGVFFERILLLLCPIYDRLTFAMKKLVSILLLSFALPLVASADAVARRSSAVSNEVKVSIRGRLKAALQADDLATVQALYADAAVLCKPRVKSGKHAEVVVQGALMREAARHDAVQVMTWLRREKKANPHDMVWDNYGHPAGEFQSHLHEAAKHGSVKVVELLLNAKVNPNMVNKHGNTALMLAAASGHKNTYDIIELLLERGANVSLRNYEGVAAVDMIPASQERAFGLLCRYGVMPKDKARYEAWMLRARASHSAVNPNLDLYYAVHADDLAAAERALKEGAQVNASLTNGGDRPMLIALNHGNDAMVRLLLTYGDSMYLNRDDYYANLYAAVLSGNPDMLDLIPYEEPKEDEELENPLIVALRGNCGAKMVAALLELGADAKAKSVWCARKFSSFTIADTYTHDEQVFTLLRNASSEEWSLSGDVYNPVRKPEELKALLATPGFYALDKRGAWDMTPLALAREEKQESVVRMLLEAGADESPVKLRKDASRQISFAPDNEFMAAVEKALAADDVEYFRTMPAEAVNANAGPVTCRMSSFNAAQSRGKNYYGTSLKHAAAAGKTDIVRVLIARGADMEWGDICGQTTIEYAAANGHVECVRLLLNAGAKRYRQALMAAALCGQLAVVDYLLKRGVRAGLAVEYALMSEQPHQGLLAIRKPDVNLAMSLALQMNHPAAVSRLIKLGADVNCPGLYPLHSSRYVEVLEILVAAGADVQRKNADGLTPAEFHRTQGNAAAAEYLEAVLKERVKSTSPSSCFHHYKEWAERMLLDKPLYDARAADGVTDLMRMACSHRDMSAAMKELLEVYPYLINMQDSHGNTALMRAECFGAHEENIKVLQQAPYADLALRNDAGFTAADIKAERMKSLVPSRTGVERPQPKLNCVLPEVKTVQRKSEAIEADSEVAKPLIVEILDSCRQSEEEIIREKFAALLKASGVDVNARDAAGRTVFMHLSALDPEWVVDELLAAGANPYLHLPESPAETAFGYLASRCNYTACERLLKAGYKLPKDSAECMDLLMLLADSDAMLVHGMLELLTENGVNLNMCDSRTGLTPLQTWIAAHRSALSVQRLLESGASPDYYEKGDSPLLMALAANRSDIVRLLLEYKVNIPDALRDVVLFEAVRMGSVEFTERLLGMSANPLAVEAATGLTPLRIALRTGNDALATLLMDAVQGNLRHNNDYYCLCQDEIKQGNVAFFCNLPSAYLEELCGPVDSPFAEQDGNPKPSAYFTTPLIHASAAGKVDIVRILLARGANKEESEYYNRTAIIYAAANGHLECVQVLHQAGATQSGEALYTAEQFNQNAVAEYLRSQGVKAVELVTEME